MWTLALSIGNASIVTSPLHVTCKPGFACQIMRVRDFNRIERAAYPVLLSLLSAMGANWRPTDSEDRQGQAHL